MKRLQRTKGLCLLLVITMLLQIWVPVAVKGKEAPDTRHAPKGYRLEENGGRTSLLRGARQTAEEAEVLLIEDTLPWNQNTNSMLLEQLEIPFEKTSILQAEQKDFSGYKLIITADDQAPAFYATLSRIRTKLERYVMNGGVLLYGVCDGGWAEGYSDLQAPGDVKLKTGYSRNNRIADAEHPIVTGIFTDGVALTNGDLYGNYASHETFIKSSLPADANIIFEDLDSHPTLVEYPIGEGFVIASGMTWEHNYNRYVKFARKAMDDLFTYAYTLARIKSKEEQAALGKDGIEQGTSCAAGDPVDIATGNYFTQKTDLLLAGKTPMAFTRFYNAMDTWEGSLGKKWHHNYEVRLTRFSDRRYRVTFEDGHTEDLIHGDDGIWYGLEGKYRSIGREQEGFAITKKDGTAYRFDAEGRLVKKTDASGLVHTLTYRDGQLRSVESAVGRFSFVYGEDGYVKEVTDSAGRTVSFEYGGKCLTGVRDAQGSRRSYTYDTEGRMLAETDGDGTVLLKNEYDAGGRVVKQSLADGGESSFAYDDVNLKTTYTAPNGAVTVFEKDGKNRVAGRAYPESGKQVEFNDKNQIVSVTDAKGNGTQYEYDAYGNVSLETDPNGNTTEYEYDKDHNLVRITYAEGQSYSYEYEEGGKLVRAVDPLGNATQLTYDEAGHPVTIKLANGNILRMKYDAKGNPTEVTDGRGGVTVYTYNSQNRLQSETDPKGNRTEYEYTPGGKRKKTVFADGSTQVLEYNEKGQVIGRIDEEGNRTAYTYNAAGQNLTETDASGGVTRYEYDVMGNVTKVIHPDGSFRRREYNEKNQLVKETDEEGNTSSFAYDEVGNLVEETDALGNQTKYRYDAAGQLIEQTDAQGNQTKYEYSKMGLLTRETDAMGNSRDYTYDVLGRLTRFENEKRERESYEYDEIGNRICETNRAGSRTCYTYDGNGNVILVEYADGGKDELVYDGNNNLIQYKDAEGTVTRYAYDARNRLTGIENALGEKQEMEYSPSGHLIRVTDTNGGVTRYEYNAKGELVEVTNALGQKTRYTYDFRGNLTGIYQYRTEKKREEGERQELVTKYRYDKTGRLIGEEKPSGETKVYAYDACGNRISMTDEEKNTIRYEYDAVRNLTKTVYSEEKTVEFTYDALGRLTKRKDWTGETNYEWDALGRLSRVMDPEGRVTGYTWNGYDKKEALTYPDGSRVEYGYDSLGRLTGVTDARGGVTEYTYDKVGGLLETRRPNGAKTVQGYDVLHRVIAFTDYSRSGEVLNRYEYGYDKAGNKTEVTRERGLNSKERQANATEGRTKYTYDALNRLTGASYENGREEAYTYDETGNRVKKEIREPEGTWETTYGYNADNQLVRVEGSGEILYGLRADRPIELEYDRRGNLVGMSQGGERKARYEYDETNELVEAENAYGMKSRYCYDGSGSRIGMTIEAEGGETVDGTYRKAYHYVYDITTPGQDVLLVYGENTRARRYTYGVGLLEEERAKERPEAWSEGLGSLFREAEEPSYCLTDEQGSLTGLLDGEGEIRARYTYDEYGKPLTARSRKGEERLSALHGYTGYQYDLGTGLYYAGARYYQPETGRFVSEDARKGHVRWPSGQNGYVYGVDNPLRYTDPDGDSVVDITCGFASALDDNVLGGFGKFLLKKILHTEDRVNDSDYDYYLGRVAGDVVSALIGGFLSVKGVVDMLGSMVFGGGIAVTSGGALVIGGIEICVGGVLAGSVEVAYGGAVIEASICSMSDDFNNLKRASGKGDSGHKIGENGIKIPGSKTVGQNGATERVDVENPNPGKNNGNMHYHEPNNTKWYYDFNKKILTYKNGGSAPPKIQKVLKLEWVRKAIEKGKKLLGE